MPKPRTSTKTASISRTFGSSRNLSGSRFVKRKSKKASFTGNTKCSTYKETFTGHPDFAFNKEGIRYLAGDIDFTNPIVDPPEAPTKPRVSAITARTCVLKWTPHREEGADENEEEDIMGFHVYLRDNRDTYTGGWICINKSEVVDTNYQVTCLHPGHFYQFSVSAENEGGKGARSKESRIIQAIECPTEPGRPHDITTDCISTLIEWTSPSFDGGTPVMGYLVECRQVSPSEGSWYPVTEGFVLDTQYFATGLIRSCFYEVRVRAVNKAGESQYSKESHKIEAIQPPSPPAAPVSLSTTATSCTLQWDPPIDDGGSPIIGYVIEQCRQNSTFDWVKVNVNNMATENKYKVTKLVKSKKYRFQVIAVNKKGPGKPSDTSVVIDAIEPPHPLTCIKTDEITFHSCVINWAAPKDDGGADVSAYNIEKCESSTENWVNCGQVQGTVFAHRVTGLKENRAYIFRVIAKNKAGEGHLDASHQHIVTAGNDILDKSSLKKVPFDNLESWGLKTIRESFQKGLKGVVGMLNTVLPLGLSISFPELKLIAVDLKLFSFQALMGLKDASEKAEILKNEINVRLEELKAKQQQKEQELIKRQQKLAEEQSKLGELERQLERLRIQLQDKHEEKRRAEDSLRKARRELKKKQDEQKKMRIIGGIFFFIPVVGATLIAVSETVLKKAVEAAQDNERVASFEVFRAEQSISYKNNEISSQTSQIKSTQNACAALQGEISHLNNQIDTLYNQFNKQSDVSQRLKECYTFVSLAAGKAEILDDQVECFYDIHPIVASLKDLALHLSSGVNGFDTSSLFQDGISLKDFTVKLHMLTNADKTWQTGVEDLVDYQLDWKINMSSAKANQEMQLLSKASLTVSKAYSLGHSCEEWALLNAQHAGWEEFIIPIPMAIAIQGQLMLVTTQRDFSIVKATPKEGFKYLRRPNSFRACLLQITHATWDAFNKGHRNMDMISMLSTLIPQHVRGAVDILTNASQDEVKEFLPKPLDALQRASQKSMKLSKDIEQELILVMSTIAELVEASVFMQDDYKRSYQQVKIAKDIAELDKKAAEEDQKRAAEDLNNLKCTITELEDDFNEALGSLPSGLEILGMAICEGAMTVTNAICSVFSKPKTKGTSNNEQRSDSNDNRNSNDLDLVSQKIYTNVQMICGILGTLDVYLDDDSLNISVLSREKEAVTVDETIKRRQNDVKSLKKSELRERALDICHRSRRVCEEIQKMGKSISEHDESSKASLVQKIKEVQDDAMVLNTEGQSKMGNCSGSSSPILSQVKPRNEDSSMGPTASTIENCKRKVQLTSDILRAAQEQYNEQCKHMQNSSDELSKVLGEIANLELQEMDLKQTIEVLIKCLHALADLRIQWGKVIQFFQRMSGIIDCTLNITLTKITDMAKCSGDRVLQGYTVSSFRRDMLYAEVSQVANISHLVHLVASSYVEISGKYVMPNLSTLHRLMGYHPIRDKKSIDFARKQLITDCHQNQSDITEMIETKQRDYQQKVERRIKFVKEEFENVHPAVKVGSASDETQPVESLQSVIPKKQNLSTSSLDIDGFC